MVCQNFPPGNKWPSPGASGLAKAYKYILLAGKLIYAFPGWYRFELFPGRMAQNISCREMGTAIILTGELKISTTTFTQRFALICTVCIAF